MKSASILIAVAFAATVSTPAFAQGADRVNAAFAEGRDSGLTPQTAGEYAMCASYWSRWQQSVENDWEDSFVEALDPSLSANAAQKAAEYWTTRAERDFAEDGDGADYIKEEWENGAEMAEEAYDDLMLTFGDRQLRMISTLGSCMVRMTK